MKKVYFFALALFILISFSALVSSAPAMESRGNMTFVTGDTLAFGDNYVLYVNSVDSGVKKADLTLTEGSSTIFSKWFSEGSLLNSPGIITAHVYSITSSLSGGDAVLKLTDIMTVGKTPADNTQPTTNNPAGCVESWDCSLWRACNADGVQTRECIDANNCGTTNDRPDLTKSCVVQHLPGNPCTENWQCSDWSDCINSLFTRTCEDTNNCGTTDNKPAESLACDSSNPDNPNPDNPNAPGSNGNTGGNTNVYNYYYNYVSNHSTPFFNISVLDYWESPFGISPFGPGIIFYIIYLIIFFLILIILYIYISSAFSSLARKKEFSHPGVAWIPLIGPFIIMSNLAKMHWWPILLLVVSVIFEIIEISSFFLPLSFFMLQMISPFKNLLMLVFVMFAFIWMWKTFKAVNRSGWWVLFNLVPVLGNLIFLILLGVAAWGNKEIPKTSKKKYNQ